MRRCAYRSLWQDVTSGRPWGLQAWAPPPQRDTNFVKFEHKLGRTSSRACSHCFKSGAGDAQTTGLRGQIMPDVSGWVYSGEEEVRGQKANVWVFEQRYAFWGPAHPRVACLWVLHSRLALHESGCVKQRLLSRNQFKQFLCL